MGTWKPHRQPTPEQQIAFDDLLGNLQSENEIHDVEFLQGQRIVIAGVAWYYEEDDELAED
jgi:predicted secreted Zn-dependent protease